MPVMISSALFSSPVSELRSRALGIVSTVLSIGTAIPSTILSCLDSPAHQEASPDKHTVWLLDTVAWHDIPATKAATETSPTIQTIWAAEAVAAYFNSNPHSLLTLATTEIAGQLGAGYASGDAGSDSNEPDAESFRAIVSRRLRPFFASVATNVSVPTSVMSVRFDNLAHDPDFRPRPHHQLSVMLGPSSADGISSTVFNFPHDLISRGGQTLRIRARNSDLTAQPALIRPLEPDGWGVVIDISDLIRPPPRPSTVENIKAAFAYPFVPAPGMAPLLHNLDHLLDAPAVWYLSSYPYNLYPSLRTFRDAHAFPFGPILLRQSSWTNLSGNLSALVSSVASTVLPAAAAATSSSTSSFSPAAVMASLGALVSPHKNPYQTGIKIYKLDRLRQIHHRFPSRRMILIGDDTKADPEIYGQIFRDIPGWVSIIFIRCSRVRQSSNRGRRSRRSRRRVRDRLNDDDDDESESEPVPDVRRDADAADQTVDVLAYPNLDTLPTRRQPAQARRDERRFRRAFRDVPDQNWVLFDEPEEVLDAVKVLLAGPAL